MYNHRFTGTSISMLLRKHYQRIKKTHAVVLRFTCFNNVRIIFKIMQARRERVEYVLPIYYNVFIVILHDTGSRVVYYRRVCVAE